MSSLETESALVSPPLAQPGRELLTVWSQRREQALSERRKLEPVWAVCEEFLAGRQWVSWGGRGRSGRIVAEPNPQNRERHTVNLVQMYVQTMMGKLFVEDLRPTIVFTREDAESESITTHTRAMSRYLWESELQAESRLHDVLLGMLTYGTQGLRVYFDSHRGQEIGMFPAGPDGQPIVDMEQARAYVLQAQQQGVQVPFVPIREGHVCWHPLSPTEILPPGGVVREQNFPWLIIEQALPLDWVAERYPDMTGRLNAQNLVPAGGRGIIGGDDGNATGPVDAGKLKDHVLVSVGYEMPCAKYPMGRSVHWNAASQVVLKIEEQLPYKLRGEPHHGIVFFHYHRQPRRFWSKGMVEDLIGPQRQRNRARSQMIEMKDRNLGRVYAKKGTVTAANKPVGKIMELIEVPLHADFPQETTGVPVGPWVENESRMNDEDMKLVSGLNDVTFGQTPRGVTAYSAMALLAEQDERRVGPTLKLARLSIGDAHVLGLELARRYWQDGKHMAISGPDGEVEQFMFQRSQLPLEFFLDVSRHAPLPTSPAVEAQKIFDVYNAATSSGQPLPIEWLKMSLDAGRALPIPRSQDSVQVSKAEIENILLLQGQPVMPAYFDDDFIHISIHRQAQMEASTVPPSSPQDQQMLMMLEQHIQMHAEQAAMKRPTQVGAGMQNPASQGGHGIEGQQGDVMNQQGLAQSAYGEAPLQ